MRYGIDDLRRVVQAPGRPPTRTEARLAWVCLLLMPVAFGAGPWWEPASNAVVGTLVLAYLCWRLRTVLGPFLPGWQRDAAVIAGWSLRLPDVYAAMFMVGIVAVVASWLR